MYYCTHVKNHTEFKQNKTFFSALFQSKKEKKKLKYHFYSHLIKQHNVPTPSMLRTHEQMG